MLNETGEPWLLHPTLSNATKRADADASFSLPFYRTQDGEPDYEFRPVAPGGSQWNTVWETRYNMDIELKNFWGDELPPDVAAVTLHIRPRTTNLRTATTRHTEYLTFYTHIPFEPLRQTLFSGTLRNGGENEDP
jgi:hypothetical protein